MRKDVRKDVVRKDVLIGTLVLISVVAAGALPVFADPYDRAVENQKTAAKNFKRAQNQEYKARRDAAEGNIGGADKHEANARLDRMKTREDAKRAHLNEMGY